MLSTKPKNPDSLSQRLSGLNKISTVNMKTTKKMYIHSQDMSTRTSTENLGCRTPLGRKSLNQETEACIKISATYGFTCVKPRSQVCPVDRVFVDAGGNMAIIQG